MEFMQNNFFRTEKNLGKQHCGIAAADRNGTKIKAVAAATTTTATAAAKEAKSRKVVVIATTAAATATA